MSLMEGDDILNNPYTRWAEEVAGVRFEAAWEVSNIDSDQQKLNLAVASGTLPDVITLSAGDTSQRLIDAGRLYPLNQLIEEHGTPLTRYVIDQFQDLSDDKYLAYFAKGDDYYALPNMADVWAVTSNNMWIRQDVLDDLGMPRPSSLSEFEEVMAAYKQRYPDGVAYTFNPDPVIAAFGGATGRWVEGDSGELVYGSTLPVQREILATLQDWYAEGYLDAEFFTKQDDLLANMQHFLQGNSLASYGMWWYIYWPFPDLWNANADAQIVALSPFIGEDGERRLLMDTKSAFSRGKAIRADFEHPERLIYLLNEHIESVYRGDQAMRDLMLDEYGYEFSYPFEQKQLPMNPEASPSEQKWDYEVQGPEFFNDFTGNPVHLYLGFHFAQGPDDLINQYRRILDAMDAGSVASLSNHDQSVYADMLAGGGERAVATHFSNVRNYDAYIDDVQLITDNFTGPPTPTMVDRWAYLEKLEEEAFTKIIVGESPLSAFDTFVEQWTANGGAEITAEVNDWYEANR